MTKIWSFLKQIIHWIWGFPQNLLGLIIFLLCIIEKRKTTIYKNKICTEWHLPYGLSLGNFIFTWPNCDEATRLHEYGHSLQSWMLGPLYLLIIGAPSGIWCMFFEGYRSKHRVSYYSFYPEVWANKLGGLNEEGEIIK